ncbi:MAG: IS110 family transposase [Actinomycetota bacterium]
MARVVAGMDAGKEFHWLAVVDEGGGTLLSRKVYNTEEDVTLAISEVESLSGDRLWAVDIPGGVASLALALLWEHGEQVVFVPGITVDRARATYRGESKTDAKDAYVIADQARMRHDLSELRPDGDVLAELALLVSHRRDLVQNQTRAIARIRQALVGLFPGLERVLEFKNKGALVLVARYQTPRQIRRAGVKRIESYLRAQGVRSASDLAAKAVAAAKAQSVRLPAEEVASSIVADIAQELTSLKARIARVDEDLETRFFSHPQAKILASLPGMGSLLGAEFLVEVASLAAFDSPDKLAAYAGLVPRLRDSGKRVGNLQRMRGGNKALKRVFYQAAFASLKNPESRAFYDRKRSEGKRHHQALLALARRRVNVLWAMLRDESTFKENSVAA